MEVDLVDEQANEQLRIQKREKEINYLPDAIALEQIQEGKINHFILTDQNEVVVVQFGDELKIYRDFCPHMGAPLSEGMLDQKNKRIQCSWHGYIYDGKTAQMVDNPNVQIWKKLRKKSDCFDPDACPKYRLMEVKFKVEDGMIYIQKMGRLQA